MAHHLAWFYVHGEWPERLIEHRDKQRDNNRLENLRVIGIRPELTAERLRSLLYYDPATGVFTRRVATGSGGRWNIGTVAGHILVIGYWSICVDGASYLAHRLSWLYVHGKWPDAEIDHINMLKSDNRIANLRAVSHAQNMQNDHGPRENTRSGLRGVDWYKTSYRARLRAGGVLVLCKTGFATAESASLAYEAARRRFHPMSSVCTTNPPIKLKG